MLLAAIRDHAAANDDNTTAGIIEDFLVNRHYAMRGGRNVRKGDIYTAAEAEFEQIEDEDGVRIQLQGMKAAAFVYERFINPEKEDNRAIAKRLARMLELDSTVFYPLLLRLYANMGRGLLPTEQMLQCLDTLESFYVRRLVCGVPTNALNKMTLELCLNFQDEATSVWLRDRLAQGGGSRKWPADEEFRESLVAQPLYPRRRIARYILEAS